MIFTMFGLEAINHDMEIILYHLAPREPINLNQLPGEFNI